MSAALQNKFARLIELKGETVVVTWNAITGPLDPVTKAPAGPLVPGTEEIRIAPHTPNYAAGRVQHFTNIPVGAIIVDVKGGGLAPLLPPPGTTYQDMTFTVGGIEYEPFAVGDRLVESWDARLGGVECSATIVLKRKV